MTDSIILSDRLEQLRTEIRDLRAALAALLQERDELKNIICPTLLAKYMQTVGQLDLEIIALRQEIQELQFRIQMVQAALNGSAEYSEKEADRIVKEKYREFHEKLEEMKKAAEAARREQEERERRRRQNEKKTEQKEEDRPEPVGEMPGEPAEVPNAGAKEQPDIKTLYKKIIKRLHPDMNPGKEFTEREKELFVKAVEAYEYGDLHTLQQIWEELEAGALDESEEDDAEKLTRIRDHLQERIQILQTEIMLIREDFPFCQKSFIEDDAQMLARTRELEEILAQLRSRRNQLHEKLEELSRKVSQNSG